MHRRNRLHEDLPSDWQSPGRFDDVRTLDLRALWEEVAGYSRDVEPLYDEAEAEVLAIVEAEYRQSGLGDAELTRLRNRTSEALDRLASRWSLETRPRYRQIAKVGRDAAADFTATPVVDDWQERADQYHGRAMQYLVRSDGLIGALRTKLFALFARVSDLRSRGSEMEHRVQHEGVEPDLEQEAPTEEVLAATALIFATQKHRIANWSGKSVELANQTMAAGMEEGSGGSVEWFVEWVSVGDGASCIDCADLGSRGYIRIADLPTYPGGDTRCRARCRCVLVSWTAAEIQNGTATFLGGGNTGTPL